jgi:signal transduction histidine kinase
MNQTETRLEGYRRLIEITRDLASTLDLDILLDRIVRAATAITGSQVASILLYDSASRELHFQVTTQPDMPTMRGLVVPLEGSIAGWVVTHRQPVRITDAHKDPRFYQSVEQVTGITTESMLGVPLITKDKVVGALEAINKQGDAFTETDEDLLLVLGAQAAVAIENARLFQQSDLIDEFVHELRTPLGSIGTATYLLLRPEMSQEQRDQTIRNIHGESLRLNAMASSFLDLARLESGRVRFNLESFDLKPLVEECCQIMQGKADEDHIHIENEVPLNFPKVKADRDKIKQVVLNLLSNAIKYNTPRGIVMVSAGSSSEEWTLSVKDTGVGIPTTALPHLFEKFYRVHATEGKVSGTGLGLSICKQIVSGHRGSIEVKSRSGKGSTFTIHIPRKG